MRRPAYIVLLDFVFGKELIKSKSAFNCVDRYIPYWVFHFGCDKRGHNSGIS